MRIGMNPVSFGNNTNPPKYSIFYKDRSSISRLEPPDTYAGALSRAQNIEDQYLPRVRVIVLKTERTLKQALEHMKKRWPDDMSLHGIKPE